MEKAIKEMGKNKAPGPSHIKNDLLKLITNKSFINHILKILNMMLETDNLPNEMILAKIILIPKRNDWEGLLSNTRPITLIDTIKKLFSQILTDRITRIINEHHILKGYNFGFTENKSTKDPLIITRTIIDDAKINKKNLNIASLDVQKAYDSVPFLRIEQALKRIKVPENFINHVLKIFNRNSQIITDMAVFLRNNNITSKVISASLDKLQDKVKCPLPLYVKPIQIKNCINHFSKYLIKILNDFNISIKQLSYDPVKQILIEMPKDVYTQGRQMLYKLNIDIDKIKVPSNPSLLMSFADLITHYKWLKKKNWDEIPTWYLYIMHKMAGLNFNYDLSQEFEFRAKINSTTTREEYKIPENIKEIELWTDGSLKQENKKMGAGILILDNKGKNLKEIMIKIDNHNPSSTKAELIAILGALEICNINQKLKIYTDSQCAIDGCRNILMNNNTRSELKYKNLHLLEHIKILMHQFTNTPTFVKVAAHTNLVNNDIADDLAKRAAESSILRS